MPESTDRQHKKRRDAIFSAWFYTVLCVVFGFITLWLRSQYAIAGLGGAMLLAAALLDFGIIIPIHISLKARLQEIQGGEEDAAAQY